MVCNLLGRHVGLEIEELVSENGRPNHIYRVYIRHRGVAVESLAPDFQLLHCAFRRWQKFNANSGFICESAELLVSVAA